MSRDRAASIPPPEPEAPMEGENTFLAHILRAQRDVLLKLDDRLGDLVDLARDIRDELIMMRKARENGG